MCQQTSPSILGKGFLAVGMVLLISSFLFFYWASRVNWDYVTTWNGEVDLAHPWHVRNYSQFGYLCEYPSPLPAGGVIMQSNDVLTASCLGWPEVNISGGFNIALWEKGLYNDTLLDIGFNFAYYKNEQPNEILVDVVLVAQIVQNVTVPTTTTLNHYETPQWVYFGVGIVLSSLAVIPIFKSKK